MNLNKFTIKVVSLLVAVMLVSSQNVFASGRFMNVTQNYTTETDLYEDFEENAGGGGVFQVTNPVTLTVENNVVFNSNSASGDGGAINLRHYNATVNIGDYSYFEYNDARYGGAINIDNGTMTIGDNSYFGYNKTNSSDGGAIYNNGNLTVGKGVDFRCNESARGAGAIANGGNITIGDGAWFNLNSSEQNGGAIQNYRNINIGSALFHSNLAKVNGGAIYNEGSVTIFNNNSQWELDFFDNYAEENGGAIYNKSTVNIGNGFVFYYNLAKNQGSAIYNEQGSVNIGNNVTFKKNGIDYSSPSTKGAGAIYNSSGTINIGSNAVFQENYSKDSGGAIYNSSGTVTIGSGASFEGNTAKSYGGTIYNKGTVNIGDNAKFTRNNSSTVEGTIYNAGEDAVINIGKNAIFTENSNKTGGVFVLNKGTVTIGKNATFIENCAKKYAGAISNNGTGVITIEDGAKFIGNTATGDVDVYGGAIGNYSGGTINLIANTNNVEFTGNKHGAGTENEESNAIYTIGAGTINLWAGRASIIFNDKIKSKDSLSRLNINREINGYQENVGTGKIVLNADMSQYTGDVVFCGGTIELGKNGTLFGSNNGINIIDVDNATINMINGKTANAVFGKAGYVAILDKLNLAVDADLKNKTMDSALFYEGAYGTGKVNVKAINITEDKEGSTRVDFAAIDEDKVITVDKARSVLYSYDAKLDYGKVDFDIDGNHYANRNGYYYTFTQNGINPVTAAGAISASVGGYATQSVVMGQAFASMDIQTARNVSVKDSSASKAVNKTSTKETKKEDTKKDTKQAPKQQNKDSKKKAQGMGLLYASAGDQVFAEPSKIERGAWLRPFMLQETVKINDIDVDNSLYGTLAGIDLPVKEDILASFYLGYAGSKQKVEEVKSNQTGYVLGATGMLIKEKWYAGVTLNMIFNKASVDTDYGTNDIDMNMFGIGAKAGYNYVINEKWTLEPNVTLMYGIVNCGSYETDKTKVDSQSVNNILLEPQVKAKLGLTNGWQPYGLLGYAANLSSKPTVKTEAGDLDLDSIGGYVEFGAGVNKDFLNTAWSCYAQLTGRAAGRSGFTGNLGVKYKF